MSTNEYPRVIRDEFHYGWRVSEHGTHKVVPADAIVIERGGDLTLSESGARTFVTSALGYITTRVEITDDVLDRAEAHARHLFAAIEYLRANPPVDEAQVEAWTKVLTEVGMDDTDGPTPHTVARRLVERGLRAPEVTE